MQTWIWLFVSIDHNIMQKIQFYEFTEDKQHLGKMDWCCHFDSRSKTSNSLQSSVQQHLSTDQCAGNACLVIVIGRIYKFLKGWRGCSISWLLLSTKSVRKGGGQPVSPGHGQNDFFFWGGGGGSQPSPKSAKSANGSMLVVYVYI